uniref:Triosephosphate isomerase n=1 Tax=Albugo laibachii Nc14 TaxID=890382 RepID=F0WNK4_9STRA|nr:triosephosphate isomerase putative [Albugo laibachii Nc14]|eukprot:CCA22895.1 triosephosphate isomerase putative [Albugo laibachii Nc14]
MTSSNSQRKPFIGGNWKCNGVKSFIDPFVAETINPINTEKVDVVIAVPSVYIEHTLHKIQPAIAVAAQNVSATGFGAYTGEITAEQLKDIGVKWTLTGHSERRSKYHESDEIVATKTKQALNAGLSVIFCIGESLEERQGNQTMDVLIRQTQALIRLVDDEKDWERIVVAYEPIWAIGTGQVATPAQAQETQKALREWIAQNVSIDIATKLRIIYGGSVNLGNCEKLITCEDVDGFLIGGASLKPEFAEIIKRAN